jgi:hypothetical protein
MKKIFKQPNLLFNNIINNVYINIDFFTIYHNISIFEFLPINYISGGLLGDFIHQLSIVNEYFMETGRKGNLYVCEIGDKFRFGIETMYNDTYKLIKEQQYINDYKILTEEIKEISGINLSKWRESSLIGKTNFYNVFKSYYDIEWGKHPWLILPTVDKWKNKIILNYSVRRKISNLKFEELYLKYGNDLIFMGFENDGHEHLKHNNINIDYYCPNSLYEFAVAINSCKLFIGGLSSPLTFAFACHKSCIIGTNNVIADILLFTDLPYINICK